MNKNNISKHDMRRRKKFRIRKRVNGTAERPRLVVYRSNRHISAQLIDDLNNKVLVAVDSFSKELVKELEKATKTEKSKTVGKMLAEKAISNNIKEIVFDRNGFIYHGRVKALADASREAGLIF